MATSTCTQCAHKPFMVLVFCAVEIMGADIAGITGQARPDDPHACPWFTGHDGSSIFRCCNGYFKRNPENLTENCIECPSGSYGPFCQENCTCENGGTCNSSDGTCLCSEQYFGNDCEFLCNCQNGATCMFDGRCSCSDGFYGELCHQKCSCLRNSECSSETGECVCRQGFYGDPCLPCNCSNNEQCDPFNGLCSCKPGYYGENCNKLCSCFNGAYCGDDHPDLCKCSEGWIGVNCTDCDKSNGISTCDDKCLHCYNGHKCSPQNGDCECSPGWQGNRCDQKCKPGVRGNNCSEVCWCGHGICDHMTDICQCDIGWIGQHCEEPCPVNCLLCKDDMCRSCKPGWTGKRCDDKCNPGFYGNSCQARCTGCLCSASCNHVNGSCDDVVRCTEDVCKYQNARKCIENPFELVCQDGWTGCFCNVTTATIKTDVNQTESPGTMQSPTGGETIGKKSSLFIKIGVPISVTGIFILALVAVVIAIVVIQQRQCAGDPNIKEDDSSLASDEEQRDPQQTPHERQSNGYKLVELDEQNHAEIQRL